MIGLLLATSNLNKILNLASQGSLSQGASLASSTVGGGVVHSIESAIKSALNASISGIGQTLVDGTKLNLGNSFMTVYDATLEITAIVAVFILIGGAIKGALSSNMSYIVQTVIRVMAAIVGSFLLMALIPKVESVFGAFSNIFATSFGSNIAAFGVKLGGIIMVSSFTAGAPMTFIILGVLILMAIFATSVVLLLSTMVAYVAAFFAPFAFLISPKSAKKILEILVVALATPTIITAIFALGLAVFSTSGPTASAWIGSTIEGLGIMLLAIFSPLGVMKLFPVGEEAIAKMGAHHQQIKSSAQSGAVWGYKSAKDIATMTNPALAEVQAKLVAAGNAGSGADTSATSGGTPSKPLNTGLDGQSGGGSTPGSTGSTGTNQTNGFTPNTPNPSTPNDLGNNGPDGLGNNDNQDRSDYGQPPPPQNPKDKS